MAALLIFIIVISIRIDVADFPMVIPGVLTGCYYTEDTDVLAGVWICPIVFDFAVCLLTLAKGLQHCKYTTLFIIPESLTTM
jgi:hypothetical protein